MWGERRVNLEECMALVLCLLQAERSQPLFLSSFLLFSLSFLASSLSLSLSFSLLSLSVSLSNCIVHCCGPSPQNSAGNTKGTQ